MHFNINNEDQLSSIFKAIKLGTEGVIKVSRSNLVRFILVLLFVLSLAGYLYYQNNAIETTYYNLTNENVPEEFAGYKIVQFSDLHNKDFGDRLLDKVIEEEPDIIVVTGDLIDRNRTDIPLAIEVMEDMLEIAPVYFVSGNHEVSSGLYEDLNELLLSIGVINLDEDYDLIEIEGSKIGLVGIEDPLLLTFEEIEEVGSSELIIERRIQNLISKTEADYTILLSHRAELMNVYVQSGVDLALTGHAHGGQVRLPFINGLYAPTQGFLPEYTSGLYKDNQTSMIVSRGLGNSVFPLRINNRPELVVIKF